MSPRSLIALPMLIGAMALPVAPALAGESDPSTPAPAPAPTAPSGPTASVSASHSCVAGHRTRAVVSGSGIGSVTFFVGSKAVKTVTRPDASGNYVLSMNCTRFSVGAHSARAVVSFTGGSSQTLGFQVTRARSSARFTG